MKKIFSTFLLLLTLCSLLTLASCDMLSKINGGEDNVGELDTYYEAYKLYAEAKGETPLSYEIWLGSVNGAVDENGRTPEYKLEENEFFISYDEGESWVFIGNVQIYGVTGEITAPSVKFQDGELYISDNSGDSWSSIGAIGNIQAPTQNDPDTPNHEHTFVNGECECGEKEPGYEPPHEHIFIDGKCECGEVDPEYVPPHEHIFVNGKCECGEEDPEYVPPHEHIFVNGECECGEKEPGYEPPHEHNFVNGKCECGETDPEYVPPHEHIFVNGKCECGEIDPEYVPPHEHIFVDGKCECGEIDPEYVPPHEHIFVDGKCECGEVDPEYAPPHEHIFVNGKCECGEVDPEYVPPHEHIFIDGKCECGETDPEYVPPHEHIFVNGKCECGEIDPEYVPPHEHIFVNGKCECGEVDPEYAPPHEHIFIDGKCECGEVDPEYVPPHEHIFIDGKCECGEVDPEYVPPHEHIFVNGKCECGELDPNYVPPHEHIFVNGKCECGETDPEYVPPHEHIFVNGKCECGEADPEYVPPHEHIFVNGECECGEKEPGYEPPHEHIFVNGKCECGEVDPEYVPEFPDITLRDLSINAPAAIVLDEGSFIGDTVDLLNSYGVLIICTYNDGTDYYLPIDPEMIYTDLNTDIPGSYTITLSVTYEGRDAIATINVIVNEVYSGELTDEDRTNLVNELYSRYGEIVGLTQIPEEMAIELDELATRARSLATHAEAEEWKHEANDYINRVSTYINFCSKGHTFTGYRSNNDATCSSDGTETAVCMFCTATDTRIEENSRLPHSYTEDVIPPTCTDNGSVTYTCSVCSYSYVDNESLPAKGHSYTEAITPPSCTEQGYTTYTCSDCSDSYIGEDRIPANGHSFVDGFCSVCKEADPDYTPFDLEEARAELISELEGKKTFYIGEGGTLPTELENEYLELLDGLKAAADENAINAWKKDAEPFFSELESALGACRDGHTIILDESNNYKPLCTECGVTYTIITLVGETPVRVKQYSVIESAAAFLTENGLKLRYTYNDGSVRILPIEENEVTGSIDTSEPGIIGVLINKRTAVGYSRITVEIEVVESDEPAPDTPTPDEPTTDENFIPVVPEDIKYGKYYMFSTPGVVCVRLVQYPDGMHVFFGNDMENSQAVYSQYEFVDGVIVTVSDDILPLVFYLDHENMQARFYQPSGESKTFNYTPAENTYCTFTLYGMDKNEGYAYTVYKTRTGNTESQMTINMKYNLTDNTLYAVGTTFYILDDNTLSTTPPGYVPITNAYLSGTTEAEIEQFTEIGSVADLLGEKGAYITYEYSDGTTSTGPITENMVSATPIDTSEPGTVSVLIKVTVDSGETFTSYFKIIITESSSEFEDIKTEYAIRYEELWSELMDEQGYEILEPYDMTYNELIVALWDSETVEQAEEALIGLEGLFDRIYKELGLYEDITSVNVNKNSITVDAGTSLDEILNIVVENVFLNVNGKEVPLTRDMVRASEGAPEIIPAGGYIYISINYTQYNVSYGLSVVVYGVCDLSNEKLIGNFIFVGTHPLITGIEIYESDISVLHLLDMDDMQVISRAEDGIVVLSVIYFSDNIVLYYDLENGTCDFLSYESEDEIIEVIDYHGSTLTVFGEYTGPGIYFAERSGIGDTTTIEIYYNKEDRMITVTGYDYIILEDGTVEACVTEEEVSDFVNSINDYFYNILPSVGADIDPYEEEFMLLRDSVYSIVLQTEFWNLQSTVSDFLNSIPQGVM